MTGGIARVSRLQIVCGIFCLGFLFFSSLRVSGQGEFLIISYNVENFLAPTTRYNGELYPSSSDRISVKNFKKKALAISQAIRLSAGRHRLGLIGLSEIDSRRVINELIYQTPLKQGNYSILHHESPDHRGIDVALLYQRNLLRLRNVAWIPIRSAEDTTIYQTREILYASFLLPSSDTLHMVQCHLPSQITAQANPEVVEAVFHQLKILLDSLESQSSRAHIIVMGDLNMSITDKRIERLASTSPEIAKKQKKLVNWALNLPDSLTYPTYRFMGVWETIDAFLLSPSLLDSSKLQCIPYIFDYSPLLEKDLKYGGYKPRRTYTGRAFRSGFSDHLPIGLLVRYKQNTRIKEFEKDSANLNRSK